MIDLSANRFGESRLVHEIIARIDSLSVSLGSICYVNYGAQISSRIRVFGKSDVTAECRKATPRDSIDGKRLSRYDVVWEGSYLDYRTAEM